MITHQHDLAPPGSYATTARALFSSTDGPPPSWGALNGLAASPRPAAALWPTVASLLAVLLAPECAAGAPSLHSPWKGSALRAAPHGAVRLGPIRIRQARRPPAPCSTYAAALTNATAPGPGARCYPPTSGPVEPEKEFRREAGAVPARGRPWLEYRGAAATLEGPFTTPLASYPGGGFFLDVAAAACNGTAAASVAAAAEVAADGGAGGAGSSGQSMGLELELELEGGGVRRTALGEVAESGWADGKTRLLLVRFAAYHSGLDLFLVPSPSTHPRWHAHRTHSHTHMHTRAHAHAGRNRSGSSRVSLTLRWAWDAI
jgi:hypothetical protein